VLLLITGSLDATSDILVRNISSENVFRLNYDLYKDYKIKFTPTYWEIENPTGHSINSQNVTSAFWWKAFNFYLQNEDKFIEEEVKYIFREIYHWCRLKGIVKGNPHDFHNHLGKMNILSIAKKYFTIPETLTTVQLHGLNELANLSIVAKSFSSGLTTTNRTLMTTAVKQDQLHPGFPWYLQKKIDSKSDITTFVCGNNYFTFERSRANLKGLDWRNEQSIKMYEKEWFPYSLSEDQIISIGQFCRSIDIDWGRIDFMLDENKKLVFLEFNANGQWVFLDYKNEYGLLDAVKKYLIVN
jgi:hypothetical protein